MAGQPDRLRGRRSPGTAGPVPRRTAGRRPYGPRRPPAAGAPARRPHRGSPLPLRGEQRGPVRQPPRLRLQHGQGSAPQTASAKPSSCSSCGACGSYGVNVSVAVGAAGCGADRVPGRVGRAVFRHRCSGSGWTTATGIRRAQRCSVAYQRVPAGALPPLRAHAVADQEGDGTAVCGIVGVGSVHGAVGGGPVQGDRAEGARLGQHGVQFADQGRQTGIVGPASYTRFRRSQRSCAGRSTGSHQAGSAPRRAMRSAVAGSSSSWPTGASIRRASGRKRVAARAGGAASGCRGQERAVGPVRRRGGPAGRQVQGDAGGRPGGRAGLRRPGGFRLRRCFPGRWGREYTQGRLAGGGRAGRCRPARRRRVRCAGPATAPRPVPAGSGAPSWAASARTSARRASGSGERGRPEGPAGSAGSEDIGLRGLPQVRHQLLGEPVEGLGVQVGRAGQVDRVEELVGGQVADARPGQETVDQRPRVGVRFPEVGADDLGEVPVVRLAQVQRDAAAQGRRAGTRARRCW